MAVLLEPVGVREVEVEVLNEWMRNEEAGECDAERSDVVPAAKIEGGEPREVEVEELSQGLVVFGGTSEDGDVDVGQCLTGHADGREDGGWVYKRNWRICE